VTVRIIADFMVRRLSPDDVDGYLAIRREAPERSPEAFLATAQEEAARSREQVVEGLGRVVIFGAVAGNEIVGMVGFRRFDMEKARHKGVVWGTYVRPAHRGKGVARALMEAVIAHARGEVEMLGLSVVTTNASARRLYESLGFVAYGTEIRAMKLGETYYDEIHMALRLG
jgi:ribosomal protein S18 acetylase RimI-like enzyme